ncbi:MAG: tetratricopeptide repeat protein [Verrucomicrobia bacterium]|nr:tetratricopeptide repeat protein [Verrucomicrobiota bacterium]
MSVPVPQSPARGAVFLSYASQDAEAARRICDALRAASVEVWFDQNELVGGDAWDAKIRKQIAECALFVPIISASTQARLEGYFRIEWKLAARRTHAMATAKAFLLPIVIDATRDAEAHVPDEFRDVQWTRLPGADAPEKFCARVQTLLGGEGRDASPRRPSSDTNASRGRLGETSLPPNPARRTPVIWLAAALLVFGTVGASLWLRRPASVQSLTLKQGTTTTTGTSAAPQTEAQKLVAQARALFEDGDTANRENFVLAEELLKRAHNVDPADGEVWAAHAQLSSDLVTYGFDRSTPRMEALKMQAERAIKLAPASVEAQVGYAGYLRQSGRQGATAPVEEAVTQLQKILAQAPQHRRALRLLGMSLARLQRSDDACAALDRANAVPGGDSEALVIKAAIHFTLTGRYSEAEEAVARSLAIRVNGRAQSVDALLKLTWHGDLDGAAQAVARWPAWLLLEDRGAAIAAEVALWRGDWERALTVLRSVPRDYLNDHYFSGPKAALMAIAREIAHQPEPARREWENVKAVTTRLAAADPSASEFVLWKACALAKLGETEEARRLYRDLEQTRDLRSMFWSCASPAVLLATTLGIPGPIATKAGLDWRGTKLSAVGDAPRAALQLNPVFEPVRTTPEFQRLIASAPAPVAKPTATITPAPNAAEKSIAVLPFANVGGDKDNEAFADGITDELISVLGRVPGLTVKARTSSFFFKGSSTPAREKGQKLGAAYLVDGSVRRIGDKVRITAQLIRAATEENEWTLDPITDDTKDVFAVQEKLAGLIAQALSLKLGAGSAASKAPVNPEAFDLYVQARQAWNLRTLAAYDRAEELLNRALALEPKFARAHAALADVWLMRSNEAGMIGRFGQRNSPEIPRLRAQVDRALALDPNLAEAHAALGNLFLNGAQIEEAARALRHAITLNPNYATAHQWLGRVLQSDGRFEEARDSLARAAALDPFAPRILDNYASILDQEGRAAEALPIIERALTLQPDSEQATLFKALILSSLGRHEEAVALIKREPYRGTGHASEAVRVLFRAGRNREAEQMLAANPGGENFRGLAALGRPADALAAMDPATIRIGTFSLMFIDPAFDPVRQDPRYVALITELGLTEAHARAQAWRAAHPAEKPAPKK